MSQRLLSPSVPAGPNTAGLAPWQAYIDAAWSVADNDSLVTAFDLSRHIPPPARDALGLYADSVQHTDIGHGGKADLVV